MSLNKSATRRLSLLAGSSLVVATLATAAFTAFAPATAFAANECAPVGVDPNANDPGLLTRNPDTFACSSANASAGVTYNSRGNLTVNATGAINVGTAGIELNGNDVDNVIFSATGTITGTAGDVLDISTSSGNITTTVIGMTATAADVTSAIRLESTGGGDITFTKNSGGFPGVGVLATGAGADAAVVAITNGGDIMLNISTAAPALNGTSRGIAGRQRGVFAETGAAGAVTLNVSGQSGVIASQADGVAAVDLVAGTGGVDINLTASGQLGGRHASGGSSLAFFVDSLALRVATTGGVTVDNTGGRIFGGVDFSGVTGGGVRFENTSTTVIGAGEEANYPIGGTWHIGGHSVFSAQDDTLIIGGTRDNRAQTGSSIDFGAGADSFTVSTRFLTNGLTLSNLETFNNSGSIYLGASVFNTGETVLFTDGSTDDLLSMVGATFTGSGSSRIYLDVMLGGTRQVGCETLTGAADCLDLRDGTTAGSTILTINDVSPSALIPGYHPDGITIVDVSGAGSSAASHFTLDPASTNGYVNPLYGAAFDTPGEFVFLFRYDAENQRHVLISQPKSRNLLDYAILSGAAQFVWHLTAETVTDRQADLRDGAEGGAVWLRASGEVTRRTTEAVFEGWDDTYAFDNSYNLYTGTIMGGADLFSGSAGGFDHVLGVQLGYVSSSFDMDESEASGRFTGATGGVYGSLWNSDYFLDATVNINGLSLDFEHPALGSRTTTYVNSVGAKAEGGLRATITDNTFLEPLLAVSWVRTSFEEISLSPGEVQPADAESLRGGLGLRLGGALPGEAVSATYFVTGRAWNEFEGESGGVVHNPGLDLPFADEFTGAFGEAEAGVNVYNADNTLSGFLTSGVKFQDGYSAVNLSLGVRMAW